MSGRFGSGVQEVDKDRTMRRMALVLLHGRKLRNDDCDSGSARLTSS